MQETTQFNSNTPTPDLSSMEQKKPSSSSQMYIILFLSILLIISLGISIFSYSQTAQLKKMNETLVTKLTTTNKNNEVVAATAEVIHETPLTKNGLSLEDTTPQPTNNPVSVEVTGTEKWKTYDGKYFIFKYPQQYQIDKANSDYDNAYIGDKTTYFVAYSLVDGAPCSALNTNKKVGTKKVDTIEWDLYFDDSDQLFCLQKEYKNTFIIIQYAAENLNPLYDELDMILRTFKLK